MGAISEGSIPTQASCLGLQGYHIEASQYYYYLSLYSPMFFQHPIPVSSPNWAVLALAWTGLLVLELFAIRAPCIRGLKTHAAIFELSSLHRQETGLPW